MKHLICVSGFRRVEVKPSLTSPGCVSMSIIGADRQVITCVTLDMHAAGAVAVALGMEAEALENAVIDSRRAERVGGAA